MYSFTIVNIDNIPWDKIESCYDHNVYKSKAWFNYLRSAYKVSPYILEIGNNNGLVGYFVGYRFKRLFNIIGSPFEGFHTPFQGLNLITEVSQNTRIEIYNELINFVFNQKHCSFFQVDDFQLDLAYVANSELKYNLHKGYLLNLEQSIDDIFKNMSGSAKKPIKAAKHRDIIINVVDDVERFIENYYEQLTDVFKKQNLKPFHSKSDIGDQIRILFEAKKILMLEAVNSLNESLATIYYAYENSLAFLVGFASYSKYQKLSMNEILMFESLIRLKELGITTLEFGGGRKYKEKYGPIPYVKPQIYAAKYNALIWLKKAGKVIYYKFSSLLR